MISFKKDKVKEKYEILIDLILNNPKYYPGSFHEDTNIIEISDCINCLISECDENKSIHFIIEKNENNGINLIVDKVTRFDD